MFPVIILLAVFLLTAVRQVRGFRFEIWQVMGARAGVPLTFINGIIYWVFLRFS